MNATLLMLLRECARGERQLNLINEFIENGYHVPVIVYSVSWQTYWVVGETRLPYKSWQGLRRRLRGAGFTVKGIAEEGFTLGLGIHA